MLGRTRWPLAVVVAASGVGSAEACLGATPEPPPGTDGPYRYDLIHEYAGGVIPAYRLTATARSGARPHRRADHRGGFARHGTRLFRTAFLSDGFPLHRSGAYDPPVTRTSYVSADALRRDRGGLGALEDCAPIGLAAARPRSGPVSRCAAAGTASPAVSARRGSPDRRGPGKACTPTCSRRSISTTGPTWPGRLSRGG